MRAQTMLKLGQIAGVLFLAGGVASCQLRADPTAMAASFILGALLYGGCRVAGWLMGRD